MTARKEAVLTMWQKLDPTRVLRRLCGRLAGLAAWVACLGVGLAGVRGEAAPESDGASAVQTSAAAGAVVASRHPFGRQLVFAHRGACGERPEHTLASYRLAMEQGADYIEPDLRLTKDGVLVALHDATLNRTTDVADHPEFADRSTPDKKNGRPLWWIKDFTLAELKTLRTRQSIGRRPRDYDGQETVPTLSEVARLVHAFNREHGTRIGLTPELREGADRFVEWLAGEGEELGVGSPALPLHLQSFDLGTMIRVRAATAVPCVWLVSRRPTPEKLAEIGGQIDGLSLSKTALFENDPAGYCRALHDRGYCVVCWTFADDGFDRKRFTSPREELDAALAAGVDAFFTDFPASGVAARDAAAGR